MITSATFHPNNHPRAPQRTDARQRVKRRRAPRAELRKRAERLRNLSIEYIANDSFPAKSAAREILSPALPLEAEPRRSPAELKTLGDMPAHLARLCEARLLSADEEKDYFRRMNFLKFSAEELRRQIDVDRPKAKVLDKIEQALAAADAMRDRIVRANMRLVVAVVKKFVSPHASFDDLLSDGTMTLFSAVEKFDYDRGFRFSTYAYRSIARNAYRSVCDRRREHLRYVSTVDEPVADVADSGSTSSLDERTWETLRGLLASMLKHLNDREQFIVSARYALLQQRNIETFQSIADKLGVSKERVRQLEQRAVNKLRQMAVQLKMEELLAPSSS